MACRLSTDFSGDFAGIFTLGRASDPGFVGKFTITKSIIPGAPGFSLTQVAPGSPIGIMPFSTFNGVEVTDALNLSFKSADFTGVTNLLLQSNDFGNPSWDTSLPTPPGVTQGVVDPYGTLLGWTIEDNNILNVLNISQQGVLPAEAFPYTFST